MLNNIPFLNYWENVYKSMLRFGQYICQWKYVRTFEICQWLFVDCSGLLSMPWLCTVTSHCWYQIIVPSHFWTPHLLALSPTRANTPTHPISHCSSIHKPQGDAVPWPLKKWDKGIHYVFYNTYFKIKLTTACLQHESFINTDMRNPQIFIWFQTFFLFFLNMFFFDGVFMILKYKMKRL